MQTNYDNLETFKPTHCVDADFLTDAETAEAVAHLSVSHRRFPKVNRRYIDPVSDKDLKYALFSFIKGNDYEMKNFLSNIKKYLPESQIAELESLEKRKSVVHGVAKIRGAYYTEHEANLAAKKIIQEVDSSNSIFTCLIGHPFPLVSEGMAEEVAKVDVKNLVEKTIAENIRQKRIQEEREKSEILERQETLKSQTKQDPVLTDLENYITIRVKLAHLRYAIDKHKTERKLAIKNEKDCIDLLLKLQETHPDFEEKFIDHYTAGRKAAGVSDDYAFEGFLKYFADPLVYRT